MAKPSESLIVSVKEAAKIIGISETRVRQLADEGKLRRKPLGGVQRIRWGIIRSSIYDWIEKPDDTYGTGRLYGDDYAGKHY